MTCAMGVFEDLSTSRAIAWKERKCRCNFYMHKDHGYEAELLAIPLQVVYCTSHICL